MHFEVEQKFRVSDWQAVEARLAALGAAIEPAIAQSDAYFAHPCRDFATTDEALRIRTVGDSHFLTYKGPKLDAVSKTRRELELPLADGAARGEQYAELLEAIGFRLVATVRKQRRRSELVCAGRAIEVALDDVPDVGRFVELELPSDAQGLDAARAILADAAALLGMVDSERRSYLELLQERRG